MTKGRHSDPHRTVLDPSFEDALVRGQEEDGGAGGLDDDLALVHLMRHAREPESLSPADLDGLWGSIEKEAFPQRRFAWSRMLWAALPIAAAAAITLVILMPRDPGVPSELARSESKPAPGASAPTAAEEEARGRVDKKGKREAAEPEAAASRAEGAVAAADEADGAADRSSGASASEQMFAQLAPGAKGELMGAVESSRRVLRNDLVATARRAKGGG